MQGYKLENILIINTRQYRFDWCIVSSEMLQDKHMIPSAARTAVCSAVSL